MFSELYICGAVEDGEGPKKKKRRRGGSTLDERGKFEGERRINGLTMPSTKFDVNAYAREREAKIERAAELRARRKEEKNVVPQRRRKEVCPGWTQHTCKKSGRLYYHHVATGRTTWTRPREAPPIDGVTAQPQEERVLPQEEVQRPIQVSHNKELSEAEFEKWIAEVRGRTLTPSQKRRLAALADKPTPMRVKPDWNHDTETRRLENDTEIRRLEKPEDDDSHDRRPTDDLPAGWTKHRDKRSGQIFYRNEDKKESTWTKPTTPKEDRYRTLWRPNDPSPRDVVEYIPKKKMSYDDDDYDYDDDDGEEEKREDLYPSVQHDDDDDDGYSHRNPRAALDTRRPHQRTSYAPFDDDDGAADKENDDTVALNDACVDCGKAMNEQALDKLEKVHGRRICPKCAPKKKRKQFNMAAQRAEGIADTAEERQMLKRSIAMVKKEQAASKRSSLKPAAAATSKWKAQSDQLREAMKSMRAANVAPKNGVCVPVTSHVDPSLVECPHCGRRFNEKAAERHIPKCRDIKAKPRTLKRGGGYA